METFKFRIRAIDRPRDGWKMNVNPFSVTALRFVWSGDVRFLTFDTNAGHPALRCFGDRNGHVAVLTECADRELVEYVGCFSVVRVADFECTRCIIALRNFLLAFWAVYDHKLAFKSSICCRLHIAHSSSKQDNR